MYKNKKMFNTNNISQIQLFFVDLAKNSFEPSGVGFIVSDSGVQLAGQTENVILYKWHKICT